MKVGIIRCCKTEDACPGTGDFNAVAQGIGAFAALEPCSVIGFINCGGCPGTKAAERAQTLISKGAQTIALATCITRGTPVKSACPHHELMLKSVRNTVGDTPILEYTH